MGLAEYYKSNNNYSQAMYIVFVSLSILPEGRKKKTRASLNIMMGNIMGDFLEYNIGLINVGLPEKSDEEIGLLLKHINRELLVFEDLEVTFPKNTVKKRIFLFLFDKNDRNFFNRKFHSKSEKFY